MAETTETFDAGFPGDTVASGVNGINAIIEGTQVYETGYHGAARVRAGGSANTTNTRFRVNLGLSGDHYGSVYCNNKTAHGSGSSAVNFLYIVDNSNAHIARFRAKPSNVLSIVNAAGTEVYAGAAGDIPVNSNFRLDWHLVGTTLDFRVFYDPEALSSSTPDRSGTATVTAATAAAVHLGGQSSASIVKDWSFDTLRAKNTGSWYDPYEPPTVDSGVTVWNGTSEVDATVTIWNGTSEVAISTIEIST
jgi:hypothetical protein